MLQAFHAKAERLAAGSTSGGTVTTVGGGGGDGEGSYRSGVSVPSISPLVGIL